MVYSIVNIELLIRYNQITGVYALLSTGQIIPFVIGIASLWKTCWQILIENVEQEPASTHKETDAKGQSSVAASAKWEGNDSIGEAEQPVVASGGLGAEDSP
jgi:hypothetical protein